MTERSHRYRCRGLSLRYVEWGPRSAYPIVAVHGASAHAHWWQPFAACLPDLRVLAPDLSGHGDSDHAEPPDYSIEGWAEEVASLVRTAVRGPFVLAGHSLGGLVVLEYAAARRGPEPQAVIVMDASGRIEARAARMMKGLQRLPHAEHRSLEEAVASFRLMTDHTTAPEEVVRHVARHAFSPGPDGLWRLRFDRRALGAIREADFRDRASRLPCPSLFVRGEQSRVVSRDDIERLAQSASRAEITEIPGAHHHIMLDRPAELAAKVRAFLEQVAEGSNHGA